MKKLNLIFATTVVLLNAGCATYFLKKDCEAKNWYQHGFELAMKGQRPANDEFVVKCRKAEANISESQLDVGFKAGMANYCKPDVAWQTGKNGDPLNTELCDPGQARILNAKHLEGLRLFCQPDSAYGFGSSGKVYQKNCPADLEKGFLKEYGRGRKKYLQAMVIETQGKVADYDRQIADKDREGRDLQFQLATLPGPQQIVQRTYVNGALQEATTTNDPYANRRQQLRWDLDTNGRAITTLRSQQTETRNKMYEYQRELTTLD